MQYLFLILHIWKQVLHSDEGPIHAAKWRTSFIAWANDVGVKIYDTARPQLWLWHYLLLLFASKAPLLHNLRINKARQRSLFLDRRISKDPQKSWFSCTEESTKTHGNPDHPSPPSWPGSRPPRICFWDNLSPSLIDLLWTAASFWTLRGLAQVVSIVWIRIIQKTSGKPRRFCKILGIRCARWTVINIF